MYYYKQTDREPYPLWTVGINGDDGDFQPESDHGTKEEAADRVRYLNGGVMPQDSNELTKREQFALAFMQAAAPLCQTWNWSQNDLARFSVGAADKLIAELKKPVK